MRKTDRETAEVIRSWMEEPATLHDTGLHHVLAQLPETPQRRHRWLPGFPAMKLRYQAMFSATKFIAAGAIVALFAGLLFIMLPSDQQSTLVVPAAESASPDAAESPPPKATQRPTPKEWQGLEAADPRLEGEPDHPLMNVGFRRTDGLGLGEWQVMDLAREGLDAAAYHVVIGSDWQVWLHDWSACGDHMASEYLPCLWQVGIPGYTVFPTYDSEVDFGMASDSALWAVTDRGLEFFDGESWSLHEHTMTQATLASAPAPDGARWAIGIQRDGPPQLLHIDASGLTAVDIEGVFPEDIPDRLAYSIAATTDGTVWVGGRPSGCFPIFGPCPEPPIDPWTGFLMRYDGETWQMVQPFGEDADVVPTALAAGSDGTLWATVELQHETHLLRLNAGDWTAFKLADALPGLTGGGRLLVVDADGTAWFDGEVDEEYGSLVSFDGETWEMYLEHKDISEIAVAPDGSIWVTGENGIYAIGP